MSTNPRPIESDRSLSDPAPRTLGRRDMLAALGVGAATVGGLGGAALASTPATRREQDMHSREMLGWDAASGTYILPPLPYAYDALEPHIDAQTMTLHHDKHHAGYVRGLNGALSALAEIRTGDRDAGETKRWSRQLAFNGSGHFLHVTFWNGMSPEGGGRPDGALAARIDHDFGSFKAFTDHFKAASRSVEGSGWGLLVFEPISGQLMVMQAEKHQNLTAWGVLPLVVIDVWEHAYYLKYQNRRAAYVDAFMNVINWPHAGVVYDHFMDAIES